MGTSIPIYRCGTLPCRDNSIRQRAREAHCGSRTPPFGRHDHTSNGHSHSSPATTRTVGGLTIAVASPKFIGNPPDGPGLPGAWAGSLFRIGCVACASCEPNSVTECTFSWLRATLVRAHEATGAPFFVSRKVPLNGDIVEAVTSDGRHAVATLLLWRFWFSRGDEQTSLQSRPTSAEPTD